jgi:hypothetical protein
MTDLRLRVHRPAKLVHAVAVGAAGASLGARPAVHRLGVRRERLGEPNEPIGDEPRLPMTGGAQLRHAGVKGRCPRVQALENLVGVSVAVLAGRGLLVSPGQRIAVQALPVFVLHVVVALAAIDGLLALRMRVSLVRWVTLHAVDRLPVDGLLEQRFRDEKRRVSGRRFRLPGEEGEVRMAFLAGHRRVGRDVDLLPWHRGTSILAANGGWANESGQRRQYHHAWCELSVQGSASRLEAR